MDKYIKGIEERKHIRSILVSASLALAIISSYTTAKGVSQYLFDIWWQAMLFSVAIQSGLFVINLKLCEFVDRTKWVLLLWVGLIVISSWFSYVYISALVYPEELYAEDADRVLTEESVGYLDELSTYMNNYELYLLKNIESFISLDIVVTAQDATEEIQKELEAIIDLGEAIEFPEWDKSEGESGSAERILNSVNEVLLALTMIESTEKKDILEVLNMTQISIESYIREVERNYETVKNALDSERDRLKEGFYNTDSETYIALNAANRAREQEVRKYDALHGELSLRLELIKEYSKRVQEIESYQVENALSTIQKEILNAKPDIEVLNANVEPLKKIFLEGDNKEHISNLKSYVRSVERYGEIQGLLEELEDLRNEINENVVVTNINDDSSVESTDVDYKNVLKNKWTSILVNLKGFYARLPEKQDDTISGINNDIYIAYDAIEDINRVDEIKAISKLERLYFGDLNDFELAIKRFGTRYNMMAIISGVFAFALDALGALFGVFIHKNALKASKE